MGNSTVRRLVVSVDDYGRDASATAATIASFEAGCISAASLISITRWSRKAAAIAIEVGLPLGVHAVLCVEKRVQHLYESITGFEFVEDRDHLMSRSEASIADEISAQVERAIAYGVVPTHMDFHMWAVPLPCGHGAAAVDVVASRFGVKPVIFPKQGRVQCPHIESRRRIGGKTTAGKSERLASWLEGCKDGSWLSVHVSDDSGAEPVRHSEYTAIRSVLRRGSHKHLGIELVRADVI